MVSAHPTAEGGPPRRLGSSTISSFSSTSAELPSGRSGLGGDGLGMAVPASDTLSSSPTTDDDPALAIAAAGLPMAPNGDGFAWVDVRRICDCAEVELGAVGTPIGGIPLDVGVTGVLADIPNPVESVEDGRAGTPEVPAEDGGGDMRGDCTS